MSIWIQYLRHIARSITSDYGDLLVLKGGTALKLCYYLPRISIDLDFDSVSYQNLDKSLMKYSMNFFKQHFNLSDDFFPYIKTKDSVTGYHCKIHWKSIDENLKILYTPLTIDISLREITQKFRNDICFQNGICTYNIQRLIDLKLNTITGQYASPRVTLRDFFDASYILTSYEEYVSEEVLHLFKERKDSFDKERLLLLFKQEKTIGNNVHIFMNLDEELLVNDLFILIDNLYNKMMIKKAEATHLKNEICNSPDTTPKPDQDDSPEDSNHRKPRM
jgi:hypothetical protein